MTDETIEGLEGQLLQGAIALMLRWTGLVLAERAMGDILLGRPPADARRLPVPRYHTSVDACLTELIPWMREAPRGFELTLATNEESQELPHTLAWFTRRLGEDEIEVGARVYDRDLLAGAATAICRAALKANERIRGEES